ncbi:hypothetical protein EBB79_17500 [Parasedimentitalea marina]|uniref:Thioredoxin-like fold domain-containing protein n=2 Tax=Parasedimentitalea marina TaxID=2483033 RepID=A0A3T0N609_9RHOB|nr:hypothetical protein EBB79_17500 [Parasedimentitalea marina]
MPGWLILQIDGLAPSDDALARSKRDGINMVAFQNPETEEIWSIPAGTWPHGIKVIPCVNDGLITDVKSSNADFQALHAIWNHGDWVEFAKLKDAFETAVLPLWANLIGRFMDSAHRQARIFASEDINNLVLLALSYKALGQDDLARQAIDTAEYNREKQGMHRMPSQYFGLIWFIDVLMKLGIGASEEALEMAETAVAGYPELNGLRRLYASVSNREGLIFWSPLLGKPFPYAYRLPQHDPFATWPDGPPVSLPDTLETLQKGQFLLVYCLGEYRTNGPFQQELENLIALYQLDPDKIADVHVITAYNKDPENSFWWDKNQVEAQLKSTGVPYRVLSDPQDSATAQLKVEAYPTLYILNHEGIVLSVEGLAEEDGYWQAIGRNQDPAFFQDDPTD